MSFCADNPTDNAVRVFESRSIGGDLARLEALRHTAAHCWDLIDAIHVHPGNAEASRLKALAKTSLEETIMWATKAISRGA